MEPTKTVSTIYWPGESVPHTGEYLVVDTEAERLVLRAGDPFPEGKAGSCYLALQEGCFHERCSVDVFMEEEE